MPLNNFVSLGKSGLRVSPLCLGTMTFGMDLVLKAVRDVDVPSRYSNTQFLVICPETNSQGAKIIAERMLRTVSAEALVGVDRNWRISVSVGYASFPKHGTSAQDVITKAEMAAASNDAFPSFVALISK